MQTAANTNRILTGCSSKAEFADSEIVVTSSGLLQHIVARHLAQAVQSQELFIKLTNELIRFAEQAYVMREVDALDEVSQVLMSLPVELAREIGTYYYALAMTRKGQRDEADGLLEQIADDGPITYRARALQTLGAHCHARGQLGEALRFQLEAYRMASDKNANGLQTKMLALWEISISRGLDGDHNGALSDLKSLRPIVNLLAKQKPFYFYAYCNALAVEFGELRRIAEARAAINVALASPYAPAYPNWAETRQEIEANCAIATPSIVAIRRAPEAQPAPQAESHRKSEPSRIPIFARSASSKDFFQRSVFSIPARTTIALNLVSILDRVLNCIGPRAPPALS